MGSGQRGGREVDHEATFKIVAGATVLLLWSVSVVVDMRVMEYDPPAILGPAVMVIITALFGKPVLDKARKRNGEDES